MNRRWIKVAVLLIMLGTAAGVALLYDVSDGHIVDYVIWRWMVTFKRSVDPVDDYSVVITKSTRRLEVYQGDQLIASYPVAFSQHGLAPRHTWADELTPEGKFLVASMQYQSAFGPRQMLLDTTRQSLADYLWQYQDEGRARIAAWENQHGLLDTIWEVYDFNKAQPDYPMWNDILIHGGGVDRDWTLGCIALNNSDLIELFDALHQSRQRGLGVPVEIRP